MSVHEYLTISKRLKAEYHEAKEAAEKCDGPILKDKYLAVAEAWQSAREIVLEVADACERINKPLEPEWDHHNTITK